MNFNRLYRISERWKEYISIVHGIKPDAVLWLHGIRRTAFGSYGNMQETYQHSGDKFSPTGKYINNMPMHFLEAIS